MRTTTALVRALLLMLVLFLVSSLAHADDDIKTSVDSLVYKHYMDGIPYSTAHGLGPGALPYLFELLSNPEDKPYWVNIVVTIGFIEDPWAIDPLITFLEETQGEVDHFTFRALLSVPYALGCISSGSNSRAIQYLGENLDGGTRRVPGWSFEGKAVSELITEQSIMALAVSGQPEARALLENYKVQRMKKTGQEAGRAMQGGYVDQGLTIMDRIASEGRAAVLNPQGVN